MEKKQNLFLRFLFAVLTYLAFGGFEVATGKAFDVALFTSPIALTWLCGVVLGYLVWDLTNPLTESSIKQWWRKFRKKDPLVFFISESVTESHSGGVRSEIYAHFKNNCDRKIKNACLTVEKQACDGGETEFIEFSIDVPPNAEELRVPLFEVALHKGANIAQYRICERYLKSNHDTAWCSMTEMAFEFEPCFSTDTQREQCAIHCTVVAPFSAKQPIKIFQAYGY